jgi:hypothetical protein
MKRKKVGEEAESEKQVGLSRFYRDNFKPSVISTEGTKGELFPEQSEKIL